MYYNRLLFVVLFCSLVCACNTKTNHPVDNTKNNTGFTAGLDVDPRMKNADSLVFVFYDDPFGEDSLRYTRFYTQHQTRDTAIIRELIKNAALPVTKFEKIKACRSEGKIWMFSKGRIFQTIYVGYTRESCRFIYLVKDGYFYYMEMGEGLAGLLRRLKLLARNPDRIPS